MHVELINSSSNNFKIYNNNNKIMMLINLVI